LADTGSGANRGEDRKGKPDIRKILLTVVVIALIAYICYDYLESGGSLTGSTDPDLPVVETSQETSVTSEDGDAVIAQLFADKKSDVQVTGRGVVVRLLSDDNDGDRHQRFILRLNSGQTLIIVHNIDIAERVDPLAVGDVVEFCGEYYYSDEGGGVHWTHHDPDGSHADGWLRVNGKTYD